MLKHLTVILSSLQCAGVCPQMNEILFNFLTVKEHVEFYAGLREVNQDDFEHTVSI